MIGSKTKASFTSQPTSADKVSADLRVRIANGISTGGETVSIVLQFNGKPSGKLNALLNRSGVHIKNTFRNLDAMVIEIPISMVDEFAAFGEIRHISQNDKAMPHGHLATATGTDNVRSVRPSSGQVTGLSGTGVGIAVLDSGMDNHWLLYNLE